MSPGWLSLVFLVVVLALVPFGVKWLQRRMVGGGANGSSVESKVLSAVAVGPRQHVVTVEVGSDHERIRLVLGVTAQSITCLHQTTLPARIPEVPVTQQVSGSGALDV